jgi:uroporphyrinogen decarboxylase
MPAIVFADILLIPRALGQAVWFEAGEGPQLGPLPEMDVLRAGVPGAAQALSAVGETLGRVRAALEPERALIGFAGAPWTVATYMLAGKDRDAARTRAYAEPELVDALLEILVEATADYLAMQARSGAQVLKLFESWAEGLPEDLFSRLVIEPHRRIVQRLRAAGVSVPVIGFPRGAGALAENYAAQGFVEGVALDTQATAELGRRSSARAPFRARSTPC